MGVIDDKLVIEEEEDPYTEETHKKYLQHEQAMQMNFDLLIKRIEKQRQIKENASLLGAKRLKPESEEGEES